MKLIKGLFKLVFVLVLLVIAALLALPLWVGPAVTGISNAAVPKLTKTEFNLAEFALNPYSGTLHVGGFMLGNPQQFEERTAASVGTLDVKVDVASVLSDTVVVSSVALKDVFVSYVKADGKSNFEVISDNVCGDKPAAAEEEKPAAAEEEKPGKKVIIDYLAIEGVKFRYAAVTVPVPPIVLKGIGRAEGGLTWEIAWKKIYDELLAKLGGVGVKLADLGVDAAKVTADLAVTGAKEATKAVGALAGTAVGGVTNATAAVTAVTGDALKAIKVDKAANATVGGVTNAAAAVTAVTGDALKAIKVDKAANATVGGVTNAAAAAKEAAGSALKAIKADKAAGAAADAVKDAGAKLKSLFN